MPLWNRPLTINIFMYSVQVPNSKFQEARMYLEHNYYTCPTDYTYKHHDTTVEFILRHADLVERFSQRYGQ